MQALCARQIIKITPVYTFYYQLKNICDCTLSGLNPFQLYLFLVPKALAPLRRSKVLVNMQPSYIDIYTDVYLYLAQPRI